MPTWKRVLLEGETDNLAGADLTQSDADRYHLIPSPGTLRFSNESAYSSNAADAACLSIDLNSGTSPSTESQFRLGQRTDLYTNSFLLGGAGSGGDQILGVKSSSAYGNHGYFDGDRFVFDCSDTSESVRIVDSSDNGTSEDPVLILHRESSSPAINDYLGAIRFNGKVDSSPDYERTFARIATAIAKTATNKGVMHFELMQNGNTMATGNSGDDPTLTLLPRTTTQDLTDRENALNEIEVSSITLRELSNRFLTTYQFGYNATVTSNDNTDVKFQDMRGTNGVPFDGEVGIPIHHNGWITGVSLSCKKSGGSSSSASVGVYIYRNGVVNGGNTVWGSEQIRTGVGTGEGMVYREEDLDNHGSTASSHRVYAGDFLRVKAQLKSNTASSFSANSFGGCISIYHEL